MPDIFNPINLFALAFEVFIKSLFAIAIIKTLNEIHPQNRRIIPALVWLLAVPGFNVIWNYFVAIRLSQSLKNELSERDFEVKQKPTLVIGLAYALISSSALFLPVPKDINGSYLYGVIGIAAIIMFVQYWMKINWYKKILQEDTAGSEPKEQL